MMRIEQRTSSFLLLFFWLAILLLSVVLISKSKLSTGMSAFLPNHPTNIQSLWVNQMKHGEVSRLILVGIRGGKLKNRTQIDRLLANQLRKSDLFSFVENGRNSIGKENKVDNIYFKYRYLVSKNISNNYFSSRNLHESLLRGMALLESPLGQEIAPIFYKDPTLVALSIIKQFKEKHSITMKNGVWVSPSFRTALIVLEAKANGSNLDQLAITIQNIRKEFKKINRHYHSRFRLILSGLPIFSVKSKKHIKADVEKYSAIASVLIMILLLSVYRSVKLLFLSMVPVITALLISVATVSVFFGVIYGITIGFGTTLIGEAVDYAIYFFIQHDQTGFSKRIRENSTQLWSTLRLGMLTSVIGFSALLFSKFPGLAQIGCYSIIGIFTAAVTTRFVLPAIMVASASGNIPQTFYNLAGYVTPRIGYIRRLKFIFIGLGILATLLIGFKHSSIWQSGLNNLSPIAKTDQKNYKSLLLDLKTSSNNYYIVVKASTEQQALERSEHVEGLLGPLIRRGVLSQTISPSDYLPSIRAQISRQKELPHRQTLLRDLASSLNGLPFHLNQLRPFVQAVLKSRHLKPLTIARFNGTAIGYLLHNLLFHEDNGSWAAIIRLKFKNVGSSVYMNHIQSLLQRDGVSYARAVNMNNISTSLYQDYLSNTVKLSLLGVLAIAALLLLFVRNLKRLVSILAPLLISVVLVIAGFQIMGVKMNLLNLVGLLLVVAIGSNYSLFFNYSQGYSDRTVLSLIIANLTTVIAFGTLAFSGLPILLAFGTTVAPGVILALLISASFSNEDYGIQRLDH